MTTAAPAMLNPHTTLQEGSTLLHGNGVRYRGYIRKLDAGGKDIPKGTILSLIGVQSGGARELQFKPAKATTSASYGTPLYVCLQPITASFADATDATRQINRNIGTECIVENVDTSGKSAGDPVYLADAQASDGVNWSLTAGTNAVQVGWVMSVSATEGKLLIAPAQAALTVAHLAEIDRIPLLEGALTISNTDAYGEVTVGALYDGGNFVYSRKSVTGAATSVGVGWEQVGSGAGTKMRINLDAAPGGGKSVTFSYLVVKT